MRSLWRRLLVVLAVLGAIHLYLWWRLVAPLPSPWREVGTGLVAVLGPSLPIAMIVSRRLSRAAAHRVQMVVYLWFGLAVYLLLGAWGSHIAVAFGANARTAAGVAGAAALAT